MWRACLLVGAAWIIGFNPAFACEDSENIQGIVYESVPADTPSSAIVLDVEFERAVIARWRGGPIEARVRRVVRGNFESDHVRVGIMNDSCLYPFVFGTEGLIIGNMREGFDTFSLEGRSYPSGERVRSEFRLGFEGVWFQPRRESIQERRQRTGHPEQ